MMAKHFCHVYRLFSPCFVFLQSSCVQSFCVDVLGNFEVSWLCTTTERMYRIVAIVFKSLCVFIDSFRARDDQMSCVYLVNDGSDFSFYFEQINACESCHLF